MTDQMQKDSLEPRYKLFEKHYLSSLRNCKPTRVVCETMHACEILYKTRRKNARRLPVLTARRRLHDVFRPHEAPPIKKIQSIKWAGASLSLISEFANRYLRTFWSSTDDFKMFKFVIAIVV